MANDALLNADQVSAILTEANGGRRGFSRRTVVRKAVSGELPYAQRIPFGPHGAFLFAPAVVELYARQVAQVAKARQQAEAVA